MQIFHHRIQNLTHDSIYLYTIGMHHDTTAKHVLSFKVIFTDLMQAFVDEPWLKHVDLSSIEQIPTEYTSDRLVRRLNDMAWRIRKHNGESLYVVVMMEVQSTIERYMAARMNMYVALLLDTLARSGQTQDGKLPQVIPLVLYSGERPWNAPLELTALLADKLPGSERYANQFNYKVVSVQHCTELDADRNNVADAWFRAMRARDYPSARAALERLIDVLEGSEHDRLRAALTRWFLNVALAVFLSEEELSEVKELELRDLVEVRQMLNENMPKWSEEWIAKGEARGLAKGKAQGLAKGEAKGLAKGKAQGLAKGKAQGLALGQRIILVRVAQARFGTGTAAEFADQLESVSCPETLGALAEWLLNCNSSEALLAKLRRA